VYGLPWITGEVDDSKGVFGGGECARDDCVDEVGASREVSVERDPPDAGGFRDVADAGVRVGAQTCVSCVEDRFDVAFRVRAASAGLPGYLAGARGFSSSCRTVVYRLRFK
jgi:hypothetical protein